jgi:hypothetical protein
MPKHVRRIFLSHASEDSQAAREITEVLHKGGFEVWDPNLELLPGAKWASSIQNALDTSDAMVVLVSPHASKSPYLQREVEYALGTERYSGRLIPVMLGETRDYPWIFDDLPMVRKPTAYAAGRAVVEILAQEPNAVQARHPR